jgi:hypothetical protein
MRFYSFLGSLIFAQGCGSATAGDSVPQVVLELTTDLDGDRACAIQPPYYCCPTDFVAVGRNENAVVCIPEY